MMNFSLDCTAGVSQSKAFQELEGNKIHEVKFDGCEAFDTSTGKSTIRVKFSNKDGVFTHTIWEPKPEDAKRPTSTFGEMPSNMEVMMYFIKHLIDKVNPSYAKDLDDKKTSLSTTSWEAFRKKIVEVTTPGIGITTKIKLVKGNDGKARFPYFLGIRKDNNAVYMKTNVVGDNLFWTNSELDKINKENNAKPTNDVFGSTLFEPVKPALEDIPVNDVELRMPEPESIDDLPF
jgi:hypothetical protein